MRVQEVIFPISHFLKSLAHSAMLIYLRNLIEKIKSEWVFLFFNVVKLIEVLLKAVYCYCAFFVARITKNFFVARITKTSLQNVWHLRTCRRSSKFPDRRNKNKHGKGRGLIAGCAICKIYLKMGFLYSPESRRCLVGKLKIVLVCKNYSILHVFTKTRSVSPPSMFLISKGLFLSKV